MHTQPDILLIVADQMTPGALRIHGDVPTQAPAIEGLAENGVVFDAAYTASPLCAPARASFLSALLPSATGVYDNAAGFASDIPTFAHYLRRSGYRTVLSGKMHFCGPDQLHGFEERLTTDIYPADYGWTPDWDHPERRPGWYHDMSSVVGAGTCVRSNQLDFDDEVAFTSQRALWEHVKSGDERPICLVVSFTHPHDPFAIPARYWERYDPDTIPMPAAPLSWAEMHPHERRLYVTCAMGDVTVTEDHVRAARRAYYGAISYVDERIAELLEILDESRHRDNTVVIVTSDHGEMLGERGFWYKMSFYEGSARVPLVVNAPSHLPPRRVASPVSTLDLLPTLVDLAVGEHGATLSSPVDGRSLTETLTGGPGPGEVAAEYLAEGAVAPIVMLRRGSLKFIHSPEDPDQLFDLANDPAERNNLATDPASNDVLTEFRAEVASRWDLAALGAQVRESQRRRHTVFEALSRGAPVNWDFEPVYRADRRYVRNGERDLLELEAAARYPRDGAGALEIS